MLRCKLCNRAFTVNSETMPRGREALIQQVQFYESLCRDHASGVIDRTQERFTIREASNALLNMHDAATDHHRGIDVVSLEAD